MKHRLIQDNDGHWYVISAGSGMERVFDDWVKAMEFPDFESKMVDGSHSVTFEKYEEKMEPMREEIKQLKREVEGLKSAVNALNAGLQPLK